MRFILAILLLLPMLAHAITGGITSVVIRPDGWSADVTFSNMMAGGTYAFGLGTNNTIVGTEKLKLSVLSQGFTSSGTATTVRRAVYGTIQVRFATPNQAFNDETTNSLADQIITGELWITNRIALSQYIFSGDSNITATITAGLYAQGGNTNLAVTDLAAINLSVAAYPEVVANWSWPGWNRETNATMRLRMVGFHGMAYGGQPLACVQFIVLDQHSVKVTNTVTAMAKDSTLPDPWPIGEYYSDFTQSAFTALDLLRCDFIAFPHIGTAPFDTTLNTYAQPTPRPASITNLCDPNAAYSSIIAVVDPAGNDTNGRATNTTPDKVVSGSYFLTIAKAANQIQASNNTYHSHNDVGAGVIYVRAGDYAWLGASSTYGSTPKCWIEVKPYPGDAQPVITSQSGNTDISDRIKITGLSFTAGNVFSGTDALWLNQCNINTAASQFLVSCNSWVTHCTIPQMAQGFRPFSAGQVTTSPLVRGNNLEGFNASVVCYTVLGNSKQTTNGGGQYALGFEISGFAIPKSNYGIVYDNFWGGNKLINATFFSLNTATTMTNGCAIVNNVFEYCTNHAASGFDFGSVNAISYTNMIVWNNVCPGAKTTFAYNDIGSAASWKWLWSVRNNLFDNWNIKSDTFGTPNAARVGNWPVLYGCGLSGNFMGEITGVGAPAQFLETFPGLSGWQNSATVANTYFRFVNNQSYEGTVNSWPGGGNYRVGNTGPQVNYGRGHVIPFDLEGNNRGAFDPPGPYASASPKKGAGFFAQ
jgi:hypothetical protein